MNTQIASSPKKGAQRAQQESGIPSWHNNQQTQDVHTSKKNTRTDWNMVANEFRWIFTWHFISSHLQAQWEMPFGLLLWLKHKLKTLFQIPKKKTHKMFPEIEMDKWQPHLILWEIRETQIQDLRCKVKEPWAKAQWLPTFPNLSHQEKLSADGFASHKKKGRCMKGTPQKP